MLILIAQVIIIVSAFEMLEMLKNQGAEGAVKIALS